MEDNDALVFVLVVWGGFLAAYLLPSIIALTREHKNLLPIFLTNALLGWTFLGWVAALVWAFTNNEKQDSVFSSSHQPVAIKKTCPACAEKVMLAAKKCRFCGEIFENKPVQEIVNE